MQNLQLHSCFSPSAGASGAGAAGRSTPSSRVPASQPGPAELGWPSPTPAPGTQEARRGFSYFTRHRLTNRQALKKYKCIQVSEGMYSEVNRLVQAAFYFSSLRGHLRIRQDLVVTGGSGAYPGTAQSTPSQNGHHWHERSASPGSAACAATCHEFPQNRIPAGYLP